MEDTLTPPDADLDDEAEEEVLLNISQRGLHVSDIVVRTTWTEQWGRQAQRFVNQKLANEA